VSIVVSRWAMFCEKSEAEKEIELKNKIKVKINMA